MSKASTDYGRFAPQARFASAQEEIFFGHGEFTMALDDAAQAHIVAQRWTEHLLSHAQGLGFDVREEGHKVRVVLSGLGMEAIALTTYRNENLSFIGMNSVVKADFLSQFEARLKDLS